MGGVQYLVHHAYEGKPKPVGADNFDRLLKYRDIRLKDEAKVRFRRRRREADEEFIHQKVFSFFSLPSSAAPPNRTIRARVVSSDLVASPTEIAERTAHAVTSHAARRAETRGTNRYACKQTNARDERRLTHSSVSST